MECIDTDYAKALHEAPFNPYSQYCFKDKEGGKLIWHISALTCEAAEYIVDPLIKRDSFEIRGLNSIYTVVQQETKSIPLKALTDIIQSQSREKASIRFVTPTAFKSKGQYVFMPSARLIFQNLLMHYSQIYEGSKEVDEETISYMDRHASISSYNLRSQYFTHAMNESRKVPSFVGTMTLSFKGPQTVGGLAKMLLKFGEYAGVGIKTSMGMGGIECEFRSKQPVK